MLVNIEAVLRVTPADGTTVLDLLALVQERGLPGVEQDGAVVIELTMNGVPT